MQTVVEVTQKVVDKRSTEAQSQVLQLHLLLENNC